MNKWPRLEILFVLLWSSGFIGAEYGLPFTGPFTLLFWRYLTLALALGLWLVLTGRWIWPGKASVCKTGVVGILAHGVWLSCVLVSLDMKVPAGIVALVTALQPFLTGLFSGVVLGEKTDARQWLGMALGFAGVSIVIGARLSLDSKVPIVGYFLPFGSAIAITFASLLQRRWERYSDHESLPLDAKLFFQGAATAIALLFPAWWFEGIATEWTPSLFWTLMWLIVAVSLGAYWTMWRLIAQQEAACVASLFYLSPPVTMLMAWLVFGDTLITTDLVGLGVAAGGVLLVYRLDTSLPSRR